MRRKKAKYETHLKKNANEALFLRPGIPVSALRKSTRDWAVAQGVGAAVLFSLPISALCRLVLSRKRRSVLVSHSILKTLEAFSLSQSVVSVYFWVVGTADGSGGRSGRLHISVIPTCSAHLINYTASATRNNLPYENISLRFSSRFFFTVFLRFFFTVFLRFFHGFFEGFFADFLT